MFKRNKNRKNDELRAIRITNQYLRNVSGSVMVEFGNTKVLCAASLEEKTAPFLKNTGKGWLTAEYSMLPMATPTRSARESARGKLGGRTHEIQRLIGRSLRAVTDLTAFGERTIYIDCDVIQADGGTRTASITGAFVALVDLFKNMKQQGLIQEIPVADFVSAVSVGIVQNQMLLDLEYEEDSQADVDMNFVMTGAGLFIEVQGTAEHVPFGKDQLDEMTSLAATGISEIIARQKKILGDWRQ
ncbi:MAG TPA: ribonuclease PH [Smithellaceae bacterium]|nr:ribonuclease PH [Smithellaceae bacterium]